MGEAVLNLEIVKRAANESCEAAILRCSAQFGSTSQEDGEEPQAKKLKTLPAEAKQYFSPLRTSTSGIEETTTRNRERERERQRETGKLRDGEKEEASSSSYPSLSSAVPSFAGPFVPPPQEIQGRKEGGDLAR